MVIYIKFFSEAWRALTKTAVQTQEAAIYRAKRYFESPEIGASELIAEYFAHVHVVFTKLTRHHVTTPPAK